MASWITPRFSQSAVRPWAAPLIEIATLLGAGVAKALLGKDVLPDDLPSLPGQSDCSGPSQAGI
jgi:hypothetical protein